MQKVTDQLISAVLDDLQMRPPLENFVATLMETTVYYTFEKKQGSNIELGGLQFNLRTFLRQRSQVFRTYLTSTSGALPSIPVGTLGMKTSQEHFFCCFVFAE